MTIEESFRLLAVLAEGDRREYNATTVKFWAEAFRNDPYQRVEQAAFLAIDAGDYADVPAIKRQINRTRAAHESAVRSAKARGLIAPDWDTRIPLPVAVERQLRTAQATEWATHNDRPEAIAAGPATPAIARAIA